MVFSSRPVEEARGDVAYQRMVMAGRKLFRKPHTEDAFSNARNDTCEAIMSEEGRSRANSKRTSGNENVFHLARAAAWRLVLCGRHRWRAGAAQEKSDTVCQGLAKRNEILTWGAERVKRPQL